MIFATAMAFSRPAHPEEAPRIVTQAPSFDKVAINQAVEKIAAELRGAYVFPEKGSQAAEAIEKTLAAKAYDGVADAGQFAQRITADLQSLTGDDHIRVFNGFPSPAQAAPPPANNAGFERVDRLRGNIGYIRFSRFVPPEIFRDAADNAMRLVASTDALILDIRGNRGGHPASVAYLSSFFLDPARSIHVHSLVVRIRGTSDYRTEEFWSSSTPTHYLDKPVYVLVGPETFSAGEAFAYNLKTLKRVAIVGVRTKGGAVGNPGGLTPIGSNLFINVSSARAENPVTKSNWAGVGVQPDVQAAPDAALDTAMKLALASRKSLAVNGGGAVSSAEQTVSSAFDYWLDAPLLKIRTSPLAGSEKAVRRLVAEAIAEHPNYELMSPEIAKRTRDKLPELHAKLTALGAIRSVAFRRVDAMGDVYSVEHERGRSEWTIFVKSGKIQGVIFPLG
ncbi:S41 family peptidase [Methylocystis sp. S23]